MLLTTNAVTGDVCSLSQDAKTRTDKLGYVHVHRRVRVQIHSEVMNSPVLDTALLTR